MKKVVVLFTALIVTFTSLYVQAQSSPSLMRLDIKAQSEKSNQVRLYIKFNRKCDYAYSIIEIDKNEEIKSGTHSYRGGEDETKFSHKKLPEGGEARYKLIVNVRKEYTNTHFGDKINKSGKKTFNHYITVQNVHGDYKINISNRR